MRKGVIIVMIIAIILVLVGGVLIYAAYRSSNGNLSELSDIGPRTERIESFDASQVAGVKKVKISSVSDDIRLLRSDDDSIRVSCYENQYVSYSIELTGNTLEVQFHTGNEMTHIFNFDFGSDDYDLTVWLPQQLICDYKLSNTSGGIYAEQLGSSGSGTLNAGTVSGNIGLHSSTVTALSCSTTSGNIVLDNITCDSLDSVTVSGKHDYSIISSTGAVSASSTSGDIEILDISASKYTLDSVSGDISMDVNGSAVEHSCQISTVSGDIRANSTGTGSIPLKASNVSGDIYIDFAD